MTMTTSIALTNVQSIVLRGYRVLEASPYQHYAYLRVSDAVEARAWLERIRPLVTSCADFDGGTESFVLAVAFTHRGLHKLGAPSSVTWPEPFCDGMASRAGILGDK